jgi:acyl-CoA thioesterase FadM
MNLLFRLLRLLLFSRFQTKIDYLAKCRTGFIVWPTDLDLLWHMNNGKYFSLMDLGRINLLIRSGLVKVMRDNGFYPVLSGETIRFKKSLQPFTAFTIQTQIMGWDEKNFFIEHFFIRNEEIYAHALVKARMLHKTRGKVSPVECLKAAGTDTVSPPLPDYFKSWIALTEEL